MISYARDQKLTAAGQLNLPHGTKIAELKQNPEFLGRNVAAMVREGSTKLYTNDVSVCMYILHYSV